MAATLRLAVAGVIVVLLARAARAAWANRGLAFAVWRRIRPRHVLGGLGLLVLLVSVALTLLQLVPVTRIGLGSLIGLSGNAIFAPVEEAALRSGGELLGPPPEAGAGAGTSIAEIGLATGTAAFLLVLLLLFPWLAYVEERTFRAGLQDAGPGREVLAALRFGLVHLVMLIPLGAALALSVAGFAYGRIYRRAHRRAAGRTEVVTGPLGLPVTVAPSPAQAEGEAVLEATVWHTTTNSLIVLLVLVAFLVELAG